ncbi:MAG: hypothetical protein ABDK94_05780 [Atribacterota bacterium]
MAKLEFFNPRKSLKEAPLVMIEDAEKGRLSKPETLIVEPTIGNTGIGLTFIFARGCRPVLSMPCSRNWDRLYSRHSPGRASERDYHGKQ